MMKEQQTKSIIVRPAVQGDMSTMMKLGRLMHSESPRFRKISFSEEKCEQTFNTLLPGGGIFVAECGEEMAGMFIGMAHEHYFSYEMTASDLLLYVQPKFRRTSAATRLVKAFETWAFNQGIGVISLSCNTGIKPMETIKWLGRMGFEFNGGVTYKENPNVQ